MDLHLESGEIKELDGEYYLEVKNLSMVKCVIIASLLFNLIIFGTFFLIGMIFSFI